MSNFLSTLAGLGYVVNGVAKGLKQGKDYKDAEEDRAFRREQRERERRQQEEGDQVVASMKAAAARAQVQPNLVPDASTDNRDVGLEGTAPPVQQGVRVNGQVLPDQASADRVATAYNSPVATMKRQADVLTGAGKPIEALQLTETANKWEADQSLKDMGSLLMKGGWKSVPEIYARYRDGKAAEVVEDGKGGATIITRDEKTGQEIGRQQYADLPQLFASVAGQFDPKLWASDEIRRGKDSEDRRRFDTTRAGADAQLAETTRHNKAVEGTNAERVSLMGQLAESRAATAAAKAGAGQGGLTLADLKDGHKAIASTLNADYKTQIESEPDPAKGKAIKTARESEIDAVQRVYTGAMSAGIALTPEQAIAAFRTGEVGRQTFKTKDGGTASVDVLRVNGRIIPMSANPGFGEAAPAAPPDGAKPAKEASGAAAAKTEKKPAKPEGPGLMQRLAESPIVKRLGELGTDYSSEAGKAALAKRVGEAANGGAPLTDVETLRAKQAGLI